MLVTLLRKFLLVPKWDQLGPSFRSYQRYLIKDVLALFYVSDGNNNKKLVEHFINNKNLEEHFINNKNLVEHFRSEVQIPEARCFYGFQIAIENIHSEIKSFLIDTYISEGAEKEKLFNSIETIPPLEKKAKCSVRSVRWINAKNVS